MQYLKQHQRIRTLNVLFELFSNYCATARHDFV